ncbi:MAG: hypothetical protein JWP45_443 [Mucilaginibacter sp.]|nr:hypothetical protein [Mucilaginibacter sp.]
MDLTCRNLFIDTQFFITKSFDFDNKELYSLSLLARQGFLNVYMTDVTDREIQKKIQDTINTAYDKISVSDTRILRMIPYYDDFLRTYNRKSAAERILSDYDMYKSDCKISIISSTKITFMDIFEDYCQGKAPFNNIHKKNEFPDAFALATIVRWALPTKEKTYLLSGDSDWKAFVNQNPKVWGFKEEDKPFYYLDDLPELLNAVIRQEESLKDLTSFSDSLIDAQKERIETYVQTKIDYGGFVPISVDEEVGIIEHYILSVSMSKKDIISVYREGATYSISFEIKIAFEYEISEYGPWDNEDQRHLFVEYHKLYKVHYIEHTLDIDFSFHDGLATNFDIVSAVIPSDFEVDYDDGEFFEPEDWWPDTFTIIYGVNDYKPTEDGSGMQEFESFRAAKKLFPELDVNVAGDKFTAAEGNKISEPFMFYTWMAKFKSAESLVS